MPGSAGRPGPDGPGRSDLRLSWRRRPAPARSRGWHATRLMAFHRTASRRRKACSRGVR